MNVFLIGPRKVGHFIFVFLLFSLVGCSSMLYYPTRILHTNPKKLNLDPEEIHFKDVSGRNLFGWYFNQKTKGPTKAKIIVFHGNAENISTHFLSFIWVLEQGYDLFIFDYSGYGRSEGEPDPKVTLENGVAAMQWLNQKKPELPIVMYGQSLGGNIALRTAIEVKSQIPIKLLVADSTFESYQSVAASVLSKSFITWLFQPLAYVVLSDKYSPEDRLCELSPVPTIVVHGDHDHVVEFEQGKNIFDKLCKPKEMITVEDGHHIDIFASPAHAEKYKRIFLDKLKSQGI